MQHGVADIESSTLGEALRLAKAELRNAALTGSSPRGGTSASGARTPSTALPPVLAGARFTQQAQAAQAAQAASALPGMQVSMDALSAAANPAPPPDNLSFLVEQPQPRGVDMLSGGAGIMWGGMGTATAGATPGAAGAPTGLFFQTGPAMQAFLAARVGAGGVGAATPSAALGLGLGVAGERGGGFRSYTSAPGTGASRG